MKKVLLVCLVGSLVSAPVLADDPVDEVTMEIATDERKGKRLGIPIREIIVQFMLENGDITQEELDELKANRQATLAEIRALREAGDREALAAKRAELLALAQSRREQLREYLANNSDLQEQIAALREEQRERMRERRANRRSQRQG